MLKIKEAKVLPKYKLKVCFEDDKTGVCDVTPYLDKGAFTELKDDVLFRQIKNTGFSIEWPNEIDLSSDTLYEICQ